MAKLSYALHGGHVISRHDGQEHWVDPHKLVRLYQLEPGEYVICDGWREKGRSDLEGLIHLYPHSDGNYTRGEDF